MRQDAPDAGAWSGHDSALWHTCEIATDLVHRRPVVAGLEVLAPFPPAPPDDRFWASGPFALSDLRAAGDGSYVHNSGFFFATGALGLAATAATAVGRAAGNANRRRAAEAAATPRWTVIDSGTVYVAPSSFTMHSVHGLFAWPYDGIHAAQMVGPGQLHFQGQSESGAVSWVLASDWAELVFVSWALRRHPRHPQLVSGGWLPPGWLARCRAHAYATRLTSPALAP